MEWNLVKEGGNMTRKHFKEFALALLNTRPDESNQERFKQWQRDVTEIMFVCEEFNSAFDGYKFRSACKYHGTIIT